MDCALALVARGRPVKRVSEVLGVARSNMAVKLARSVDWRDGRTARLAQDAELVEAIQKHIGQLPSYGYRRVWALVRRDRERRQELPINAKRVYRVMRDHDLLLERRRRPQMPARHHDGQVAVLRSNQRWCAPTGSNSAATMATPYE